MHIAIIADGNRRWAKRRGKNASHGHDAGIKNAEKLIHKAKELKINSEKIKRNLAKKELEMKAYLIKE